MPVYRAKYEVEVEADVNYTVIRERDTPYPNDRTAIGAFEELFGENLISIEDLEENRLVGIDHCGFCEFKGTSEEVNNHIAEEHPEPLPLDEMSRDELDEVARALKIDPEPLKTKADVIVAIDLVQKSG